MRTLPICTWLCCVLGVGLARAQPAAETPAPASPVDAAATRPAAEPAVPAASAAPSEGVDARSRARELYGQATRQYASGNFGSALELLDQAFALHDAPTLLLARAHTLDRIGRAKEAARAYQAYLRRRPDDPEALAIRARVAELAPPSGTSGGAEPAPAAEVSQGEAGRDEDGSLPMDSGEEEADEPGRPNEKRRRDQFFFFRAGAVGGIGSASRRFEYFGSGFGGYSGSVEQHMSPSLMGASVSAGITPIPGFSIAAGLRGGYLSAKVESQSHDVPEDDDDGRLDHSGPLLMPELEIHGFPWTRGPLHLVASGGLVTGGGDELDDFFGIVGGAGVGAAFFVGDQTSIDLLARSHYMPSGDRDSSLLLWTLDVGVLLQ